jgi:hypothetical protein
MIGRIEAVHDNRHAAVALDDVATERVGNGAEATVGGVSLKRRRAIRDCVGFRRE